DEVEIILDYKTESYVSIGWRPEHIDTTCRLFPDLEHGYRYKREPPTLPPPEFPKNNGFLESALNAPLHPMDCTDIIVGAVKDGYTRVQDMYTRDRSTPLNDEWFDGEMSLSAAYGIETNGRTIVMFRRNVREIEPTDHPLGPGQVYGIYAKGQDPDVGGNLYKKDQLKYHGSANRGVFLFEFVPQDEMPPTGPLLFIKSSTSTSPESKKEHATTNSPTTSFVIADLEPEEESEIQE
uniref:DOMON domain-containing protein n=1 Tax=Acrobeloides nanus TaxID=290746 RepID=A0A914DDS9_9BILA